MSTITESNPATGLASWIRRVSGMYSKDLKALNEDAYTKSAGGKCRTLQDITAEVSGFNFTVADLITGKATEWKSEDVPEEYAASLSTIAAGEEAIRKSGDAIASALESHPQRLGETVVTPWGETMSLFDLANLSGSHIMYHDGQLNFVQSLNGDDKMHWFDE